MTKDWIESMARLHDLAAQVYRVFPTDEDGMGIFEIEQAIADNWLALAENND